MESYNRPNCQGTHVHEVQGSVQIAERGCDAHNHRFASMTGKAIPANQGNHYHEIVFRTDSYEGHYHEFCGKTTVAYPICGGHVHYLEGITTTQDGHIHCFKVITHVEDPIEK